MIDFYLGKNHLELVGVVCAAVLVVFPLLKLSICGVRKQIGRLSLYAKILLGFCIVNSIIVCGTKTNEPPRSAGATLTGKAAILAAENTAAKMAAFPVSDGAGRSISLSAFPVMVTPEDIARGYRIESVTTNTSPFAEMPSNAVEYAKWSLRGGRETWFPLDLGELVFPLGTNFVNRLCVISGGMVETYRALNGRASICAAREYASLVPGVSRFWSADADDGAKVLRWENIFASRDRSGEYSVEMRLSPNGDFTTRSNEVETVFRRVNPYDWDGDGIANEIDDNPQICDGDYFGTANQLPTNANLEAYYWLDLAATGTLGVAKISVVCDGPSDLGDHSIIVRTNQVCHIPLLAGATYTVESDLPISYSAVSSEYAQIATNSEKRLTVALPLVFYFERVQMRGGFDNYIAHTSPVDVGPRIADLSGGCCSCITNEVGFSWVCSGNCYCGGYWHDISVIAIWGGYSRLFDWSGWCPCIWHGDLGYEPGSPRLVLDMPRTLFTNNNGGAEPSDIVRLTAGLFSPAATNGTLTLDVFPPDTVAIWQNSNKTEQVSLPLTWDIEETPCKELYVEGLQTKHRNLASIGLQWRDGNDVRQMSVSKDFAVYSPNLNVINNSLFDNGDLCNPSGIVVGTNACFALEFDDVTPPSSEIVWSIVEGNAQFVGGSTGPRVRLASGVPGQRVTLQAQIDDCRSRPPTISAFVVEPLAVKLTVWIVGDNEGSYYASDASAVSNLVVGVNKIYEQTGVSFYVDSICYTNKKTWLDIRTEDKYSCDLAKRRALVNSTKNSGGLELYFVDRVANMTKANHDEYGIVIGTNVTAKTIAHEIGHAFGCADVYNIKKSMERTPLPDTAACQARAPHDWNNGTGCRYYKSSISQQQLICRLPMCGYDYPSGQDMSSGSVFGYTKHGETGLVDVGFFNSGIRRSIQSHK